MRSGAAILLANDIIQRNKYQPEAEGRDGSRGGSVGLLEHPFGKNCTLFSWEFWQVFRNLTCLLRIVQNKPPFRNPASSPGRSRIWYLPKIIIKIMTYLYSLHPFCFVNVTALMTLCIIFILHYVHL